MKCHAGVEFASGKPCPKCGAGLGEVCWLGINADLLELAKLREENARLREAAKVIPDESQEVRVFDGDGKTCPTCGRTSNGEG